MCHGLSEDGKHLLKNVGELTCIDKVQHIFHIESAFVGIMLMMIVMYGMENVKLMKFVCCRLSELEQKRDETYDKLGRHKQFGTKEERDAWLCNELEYVLCIIFVIIWTYRVH